MPITVIEDEALTLFPVPDISTHFDLAKSLRLRDDESKVVAQNSFVRSPVSWDVFLRRKYREHRGFHAWYAPQQSNGLRTPSAVLLILVTVNVEEERLPIFALSQASLIRRDILEIGYVLVIYKHGLKFRADFSPFMLELRDPRKSLRIEEILRPEKILLFFFRRTP